MTEPRFTEMTLDELLAWQTKREQDFRSATRAIERRVTKWIRKHQGWSAHAPLQEILLSVCKRYPVSPAGREALMAQARDIRDIMAAEELKHQDNLNEVRTLGIKY